MFPDIQAIIRVLEARRVGARWMAKCPAHRDDRPSLSISAQRGKVLVHCFAGCSQRAVIEALHGLGVWPGHEVPRGAMIYATAERLSSPELRSAAELWTWAAIDMGERLLADLKGRLFDPIGGEVNTNEIRYWTDLTGLWGRMDAESRVTEYLDWRERQPELTAAMVAAARIDRGAREAYLRGLLGEL